MANRLTANVNDPRNGAPVGTSLGELQQAVGGGLIELVYLPDNKLMVVNEEGLLWNYPFNEAASLLAMKVIVGDVVIAHSNEID
jgi:hypothetical protein